MQLYACNSLSGGSSSEVSIASVYADMAIDSWSHLELLVSLITQIHLPMITSAKNLVFAYKFPDHTH